MTTNVERTVLACLLALFACRVVVAGAIVPPWQAPDEPTHVYAAQLLALDLDTNSLALLPDRSNVITSTERELQRNVLESMARHRWWEARGGRAPQPLPTLFVQADAIPSGSYSQPLYYGLAAAVLRATRPSSIDAAYWDLRTLGALLALATLGCAWAGTRLLFGPAVAAGATAIAALHPQFLLTAIAAHPDGLVDLCGAFIWWQAARTIRGRRFAMSLALLLVAATAAVLIKRSAVPLVIAAVLVAASLVVPQLWNVVRRRPLLTLAAAVAVVAVLSGLLLAGVGSRLGLLWQSTFITLRPRDQATIGVFAEYAGIAVDYAWLVAGWQRYSAPEPWLWIARAVTGAGAVGAAVCAVRCTAELRPALLLAWVFVTIQVAAIVGPGFWNLAAPQGRYLFAVLAPLTVLLWMGLEHAVPGAWRRHAAPAIVGLLALMDVTGFAAVLLPAYVPAILYVP